MAGPAPIFCPWFPEPFLEIVRKEVRRKTASRRLVQRCQLALLVHAHPDWDQKRLGQHVGLSGRQVHRWRRRWAAGDFSLEDVAGRGRKADFSPSGSCLGQGPGLRAGRGDGRAYQPAILGGSHDARAKGAGKTDQPQQRVANLGRGCHQALATRILDLPARSSIPGKGGADPRPVGGAMAGKTPGKRGLYRQRRREDQHSGPPANPSVVGAWTGATSACRK